MQLIFHVVTPSGTVPIRMTESFLTYVQWFDIVPQINHKLSGSTTRKGLYPDPASSMFMMKRAWRQDDSILGDIIPLVQLRALVELTPIFGEAADHGLSKESSLEYSTHFWLDKYVAYITTYIYYVELKL